MKPIWIGIEFSNGVYTASIPQEWKMVLKDDVVSFSDGSDNMAIVISSFSSEDSGASFETPRHLERYLQSADVNKLQIVEESSQRSYAMYRSSEERVWHVSFESKPPYLLLVTLNFSIGVRGTEQEICLASFNSVRLSREDG